MYSRHAASCVTCVMRSMQTRSRNIVAQCARIPAACCVQPRRAASACGRPQWDITASSFGQPRRRGRCSSTGHDGPAVLGHGDASTPSEGSATDVVDHSLTVDVDICVEGELEQHSRPSIEQLRAAVERDAALVVQAAVPLAAASTEPQELSVVLCDDDHIQMLNLEWRQKDAATDVLSFPNGDDVPPGYPARMLGDIVISLDTAARQAADAGHSLEQECRVLLVHGVLHLLGHDHELGQEEAEDMSQAEAAVMAQLGWKAAGLIESAGNGLGTQQADAAANGQSGAAPLTDAPPASGRRKRRQPGAPSSDIQLLACDMDGTLLDSSSRVLPSTVEALKAAIDRGIRVVLATGKARPAAIAAMQTVGLAGEGLVVSQSGPGIFLQGLAVYDLQGVLLPSPNLSAGVVADAFRYSVQHDTPLCAFLGDACATLKMHPEIEELSTRYFEPLAQVAPTLEDLLAGPAVKKLLFMTDPHVVDAQLKPHWQASLAGSGAEMTQAVSNMLEILPEGMHKWVGMDVLLQALQLDASQVMTIGDGSNDLQLVGNAGIGVCMANGVGQVKDVATYVTSSHDHDGVAEAIERFLL